MTLTEYWQIFAAGCFGGVCCEALHWLNLYRKAKNGNVPQYGRHWQYWLLVTIMIFIAGGMCLFYFGARAQGIAAVHVGASTPLILQKLVTTMPRASRGGGGPSLTAPWSTLQWFSQW
jgi:hypothetical protein